MHTVKSLRFCYISFSKYKLHRFSFSEVFIFLIAVIAAVWICAFITYIEQLDFLQWLIGAWGHWVGRFQRPGKEAQSLSGIFDIGYLYLVQLSYWQSDFTGDLYIYLKGDSLSLGDNRHWRQLTAALKKSLYGTKYLFHNWQNHYFCVHCSSFVPYKHSLSLLRLKSLLDDTGELEQQGNN